MEPLHEDCTVNMGHLIHSEELFLIVYQRTTKRFSVTRFHFRRPPTGTEYFEFGCRDCEQEWIVRARSIERTKQIRKRYLVTALIAAAFAAALVGFGFLVYLPLSTALGKFWLISFLLSLPVIGIAGWAWWHEDGVQVSPGIARGDDGHEQLDEPLVPYLG